MSRADSYELVDEHLVFFPNTFRVLVIYLKSKRSFSFSDHISLPQLSPKERKDIYTRGPVVGILHRPPAGFYNSEVRLLMQG